MTLAKAILLFQYLNVDFRGPLPVSKNGKLKYMLTIMNKDLHFPFAYPCKDMTSTTLLNCLNHLFPISGISDMIHSDRGLNLLSTETTNYLLHSKGIVT